MPVSDLGASEAQGEFRVRKYLQGTLSRVGVRDKKRAKIGNDENWADRSSTISLGQSTMLFARIENIDR